MQLPNINQHCYLCHQYSKNLICLYCLDSLQQSRFGQHCVTHVDLLRNPIALQNLDEPEYDHLHAIDNYIWPIDKLVLDLKFAHKSVAARALVDMFLYFIYAPFLQTDNRRRSALAPSLIIPVPLSNKRYWQRQYNQSQLLCDWLSKATGIANDAAVTRVKHTRAQTELNKQERLENVRNAFACRVLLPHKHVVVVDDVITTGVTINAVCTAIKQRNPNIRISVWVMAITLLN